MGVRYRKSINLGCGFRVNLSTSGIGYSWGVKGYRVTKKANGGTRTTVSIPGTGISYVTETSGKKAKAAASHVNATPSFDALSNYNDIKEIKSADLDELHSAEYEDLLKQIKYAEYIRTALAVVAIFSIFVAWWLFCIVAVVSIIFYAKSRNYVVYEFDDEQKAKWDELYAAWNAVAKSKSIQQITLQAKAKNKKVTAGIENAVDTVPVKAGGNLPFCLRTNIKPVVFTLSDCSIAIMPDRLFVFNKAKVGAITYDDVDIKITAVGFVETGKIPPDAEVVKYVWAAANKDGFRDKRYANNKQYPVMKYGKLAITSNNGLNIQFMFSNESATDQLEKIMNG